MSYIFADSLRADSGRNLVPSWSCSQTVSKPLWHIPLLCVQWKTPDAGQRNCPKHVEFYSKNKFEKLVHLVGFIIRIYHDARSTEGHILSSHRTFDCRRLQTALFKNNNRHLIDDSRKSLWFISLCKCRGAHGFHVPKWNAVWLNVLL